MSDSADNAFTTDTANDICWYCQERRADEAYANEIYLFLDSDHETEGRRVKLSIEGEVLSTMGRNANLQIPICSTCDARFTHKAKIGGVSLIGAIVLTIVAVNLIGGLASSVRPYYFLGLAVVDTALILNTTLRPNPPMHLYRHPTFRMLQEAGWEIPRGD